MAFSGLGKFISVAKEMRVSAAMLLVTSRGRRRAQKLNPETGSVTVGGLYSRAQLEANKVFDVVVNSFSLLDGRPADRKQMPTFEPQTLQSHANYRNKLFQ